MDPAQIALDQHRASVRYLAAMEVGRWSEMRYEFPHLYLRVAGRDPATEVEFVSDYHLLCDDYPATGPYVERWDCDAGVRPPPPTEGAPQFVDALKDWFETPGRHGGVYRAWQRGAANHNAWASKRPDEAWRPDREITFIAEHLYALNTDQACWLAATRAASPNL